MNVNDLELFLNETFPVENALDYDNVGLIAGDRNKIVTAILVSLDLTDKAIEAAKEAGANVIVTHHPIIFGGIKTLTMDDCIGKTLVKLVQSGISVIACHTNLDLTNEFGNLAIADKLGAEEPKPVKGAVCGVVYELPTEMKLDAYCRKIATDLGSSGVITIKNPENTVRKVMIQGGSFDEDSLEAVIKGGVDTVLSGEIKHHICVLLDELGISTIIAGHSATEQVYLPKLKKTLEEQFSDVEFIINYNDEKNQK